MIQDPTRDELRDIAKDEFGTLTGRYPRISSGPVSADEFDIECACYWIASHYHGGQGSNLYSDLSTSPYTPGLFECAPDPGSTSADLYRAIAERLGA